MRTFSSVYHTASLVETVFKICQYNDNAHFLLAFLNVNKTMQLIARTMAFTEDGDSDSQQQQLSTEYC